MPMNGFSIILGGGHPMGPEPADDDRDAALEAMRRFREAKDDETALEAFTVLCRYAKGAHGEEGGEY
jgi:hypothetical protein